MLIRTLLIIAVASSISSAFAAAPATTAPSGVPRMIHAASSVLRDYLKTFHGKSETEVAEAIGRDFEKDTWSSEDGKKELLIRYKFDERSTLALYFAGDKVVTAEIYVIAVGAQ